MSSSAPNPYRSPESQRPEFSGFSLEELKGIAQWQRLVIAVIGGQLLGYCVGNYAIYAAMRAAGPQGQLTATFAVYAVILLLQIAGVMGLAILAYRLWGTGPAIVAAILSFVPCVSLIVMLVVNGSATSVIQRAGYRVGFFGANDPRLR